MEVGYSSETTGLYSSENTAKYKHSPQTVKTSKYIKAVPLQAWSGPEGSRKLRFPDFLTKAQYGGKVK
jgi:hypothetical protein